MLDPIIFSPNCLYQLGPKLKKNMKTLPSRAVPLVLISFSLLHLLPPPLLSLPPLPLLPPPPMTAMAGGGLPSGGGRAAEAAAAATGPLKRQWQWDGRWCTARQFPLRQIRREGRPSGGGSGRRRLLFCDFFKYF